MKDIVKKIIACPKCKGSLIISESIIKCGKCKLNFDIKLGSPVLEYGEENILPNK